MKKGLSCIVTCFNSEKYIRNNIFKLIKILSFNNKYEVIAIDDCSKDKTYSKLKKIKLIRNGKNLGKAASIIKALKKTSYDKVIFIDSDLPYVKNLKEVIRSLKTYDLVFVDRRHVKSKKLKHSPCRDFEKRPTPQT